MDEYTKNLEEVVGQLQERLECSLDSGAIYRNVYVDRVLCGRHIVAGCIIIAKIKLYKGKWIGSILDPIGEDSYHFIECIKNGNSLEEVYMKCLENLRLSVKNHNLDLHLPSTEEDNDEL